MSAAVILTAYSAYESTRWSGVRAASFAEASGNRTDAATIVTLATTELSYDASAFRQFAFEFRNEDFDDAAIRTEISDLTETLLRDEFKPYFDEWLALDPQDNPDAPRTPFDLPDFESENFAVAGELEVKANEKFAEAKDASQTGDNYALATVFFASVLFFAGISSASTNMYTRGIMLAIGSFGLVAGIVWIATLPFH